MYAATANGWMEECIFHQWFKLMFTPHVAKVRLLQQLADSPAILFLDGHSSHTSISIIELAIENNITIIKFPLPAGNRIALAFLLSVRSFKSVALVPLFL